MRGKHIELCTDATPNSSFRLKFPPSERSSTAPCERVEPEANQLVADLLASRTSNFTLARPDLTISSRSAAASDKSMIRP